MTARLPEPIPEDGLTVTSPTGRERDPTRASDPDSPAGPKPVRWQVDKNGNMNLQLGGHGGRGNRLDAKLRRRLARDTMVKDFLEVEPRLMDMAKGHVKIILGIDDSDEAAELFYEIFTRLSTPEADRVIAWSALPTAVQRCWKDAMRKITKGTLSQKEIAVEVGVADQRYAIELMLRYGLGATTAITDADGESIIPGVLAIPKPDMVDLQGRMLDQMRGLRSGEEVVDAEYEYVEEDVTEIDRQTKDLPPAPFVETVSPALVAVLKSRRVKLGDTNGNNHREPLEAGAASATNPPIGLNGVTKSRRQNGTKP
jgi:hypothetical protein